MSQIKCINCRKTVNGNPISVFGFKMCQPCDDAEKEFERLINKGLELEILDPKTGKVEKKIFKG